MWMQVALQNIFNQGLKKNFCLELFPLSLVNWVNWNPIMEIKQNLVKNSLHTTEFLNSIGTF